MRGDLLQTVVASGRIITPQRVSIGAVITERVARIPEQRHAERVFSRPPRLLVEDVEALGPEAIVISPGPCTPNEAGVSLSLIERAAGKVPILGVCLGHQAIGQAFGGKVVRSDFLMHGKTSLIHHDGKGLFTRLPNPFEATRYHSLVVERATLPASLEITAWVEEGDIMGLRHRQFPIWGVQFHPESILTTGGKDILRNFLEMSKKP